MAFTPSTEPLSRPIPFVDPARAFAAFADEPVCAFLDSADRSDDRGRYAYIAADPCDILSWRLADGTGDPFDTLARKLNPPIAADPDLPPFQTGAVGFLGYETGGLLERLPDPRPGGPSLPDLFFGFYDTIAAFDLHENRAWVIATEVSPDRPPAFRRLDAMAKRMANAPPRSSDPGSGSEWIHETSRNDFEARVAATIEYIRVGDIYQANISQRFLSRLPGGLSPAALHQRLRCRNPAPFAAYLACGRDQTILSASPERFLSLDSQGRVETRPIKGTRRRGADAESDAALAAELLASDKDRAENLMIVDLLRNDLSRVARIGSVHVPTLCGLESFAAVHHLVSVIEARLRPSLGPVDLLRACFPGGSITGAPKIRAMEIIHELEAARRGPYCGSIAWIGRDGAMDSSIVIRTLVIDGSSIVLQAGGGIVADSDPAAEYAETLDKARALMQCLEASDSAKGGMA
ncbi:MAG: aminodeoxychorismate synthase component I [Rhodospirillales bacterium]|nr:aminodeoxychorismate synthase component I [Rhodospirillales bacterium]